MSDGLLEVQHGAHQRPAAVAGGNALAYNLFFPIYSQLQQKPGSVSAE